MSNRDDLTARCSGVYLVCVFLSLWPQGSGVGRFFEFRVVGLIKALGEGRGVCVWGV